MPIFAMYRVKVERITLFVKIVNQNSQKKVLRLASEKLVLASGTNPVTRLASWKVSLEPCIYVKFVYVKATLDQFHLKVKLL